jgi:predicted NAD/FAD-dependent oxidoreductase
VTAHRGRIRVAVVGAGIAGLACARHLAARGVQVTVFERSRAPGGRVATRRTDAGGFDHGAQYFTVQSHRFESTAQQLLDGGAAQRWRGRLIAYFGARRVEKPMTGERLVGAPGMSDLARFLARGLDVRLNTRIVALESRGDRWFVRDDLSRSASVHGFDAVCVALPSSQAAGLIGELSPLGQQAETIRWEPCWAVMLALGQPSKVEFDGAFINDDAVLGWVARDSAKPGRRAVDGVAERWVLHARPAWSREFLELDAAQVAQGIVRAFAERLQVEPDVRHLSAHRWRFATPANPLPQPCLWDARSRLGAAGDWCGGPRIEGAYLSGLALAEAVAG